MDNDSQAIAGCATILILLIAAPFIIAAVPVLLGATLGFLGFWAVVLFVSAVFRSIFK
jgi:hypothetical protein